MLINLRKKERHFGVLRTLGWLLEWNTALIHCALDQLFMWGSNTRGEYRRQKADLMSRILSIDEKLQHSSDIELITERHRLVGELEKIMEAEELYWRQKGGEERNGSVRGMPIHNSFI